MVINDGCCGVCRISTAPNKAHVPLFDFLPPSTIKAPVIDFAVFCKPASLEDSGVKLHIGGM